VVDASPINGIEAIAVQRLDELQSELVERELTPGVARARLSLCRAFDPGWVAQQLASKGLRRSPTLKAARNAFSKRKLDADSTKRRRFLHRRAESRRTGLIHLRDHGWAGIRTFAPRTPPSR
jgi:hypothetical protein